MGSPRPSEPTIYRQVIHVRAGTARYQPYLRKVAKEELDHLFRGKVAGRESNATRGVYADRQPFSRSVADSLARCSVRNALAIFLVPTLRSRNS
jgi:hypothetical protein